jgi:biopolymer transport protein ExbB/TolQ
MLLALLQDVPGQKQAEGALDTLAGQGILGSFCVLLIIALFFTVKSLLKAKDDRFSDQKMMVEALQKHNEAAKDFAIEMSKSASNVVVEMTRIQDTLKNALNGQEKSFDGLQDSVKDFEREITRIGAKLGDRS